MKFVHADWQHEQSSHQRTSMMKFSSGMLGDTSSNHSWQTGCKTPFFKNKRFARSKLSPLPRWLNMKLSQPSVALSKFSTLYLLLLFFVVVQTWQKMPGRNFKLSRMTQFTYHSRQFTNLSQPMPKAATLQGVCSRIWRWCCCQFCFHFMFELNESLFLGLATYLQFTQLPCEPVYLIILYELCCNMAELQFTNVAWHDTYLGYKFSNKYTSYRKVELLSVKIIVKKKKKKRPGALTSLRRIMVSLSTWKRREPDCARICSST